MTEQYPEIEKRIKVLERNMIILSIFITLIVSIFGSSAAWSRDPILESIFVFAVTPIGGGVLLITLIITFIRWRKLKKNL